MDKVDTQEAGGRQERHWGGFVGGVKHFDVAVVVFGEVFPGTTAMMKEPVALAEVVAMVLAAVRIMSAYVSLLC